MKHHRSKILPLRWFANKCSYVSVRSLVKAFDLQEDENFGIQFKFHCKVCYYFNKPYEKWGTYHTIDLNYWMDIEEEL